MRRTVVDFEAGFFLKALEAGNLPLRPDKGGLADTRPPLNPLSGRAYNGTEAFFLKAAVKEKGFSSCEFLSLSQVEGFRREERKAGRKGGALIKSGERLSIVSFREETREGRVLIRRRRMVNLEQSPYCGMIREYTRKTIGAPGAGLSAASYPEGMKLKSLSCVSSDPAQVMGLYLAALRTGRPFTITMAQYQDWTKKTRNILTRPCPARSPAAFRPNPWLNLATTAIKSAAKVAIALAAPGPAVGFGISQAAGLGAALIAQKVQKIQLPARGL
jgi:hypothetical protein